MLYKKDTIVTFYNNENKDIQESFKLSDFNLFEGDYKRMNNLNLFAETTLDVLHKKWMDKMDTSYWEVEE